MDFFIFQTMSRTILKSRFKVNTTRYRNDQNTVIPTAVFSMIISSVYNLKLALNTNIIYKILPILLSMRKKIPIQFLTFCHGLMISIAIDFFYLCYWWEDISVIGNVENLGTIYFDTTKLFYLSGLPLRSFIKCASVLSVSIELWITIYILKR